jgi:hypothetical protein
VRVWHRVSDPREGLWAGPAGYGVQGTATALSSGRGRTCWICQGIEAASAYDLTRMLKETKEPTVERRSMPCRTNSLGVY